MLVRACQVIATCAARPLTHALTHSLSHPLTGQPQLVSQAYCSAISCAYGDIPVDMWEPLATLVLDACYEATLWAAVLNARRSGCNKVVPHCAAF